MKYSVSVRLTTLTTTKQQGRFWHQPDAAWLRVSGCSLTWAHSDISENLTHTTGRKSSVKCPERHTSSHRILPNPVDSFREMSRLQFMHKSRINVVSHRGGGISSHQFILLQRSAPNVRLPEDVLKIQPINSYCCEEKDSGDNWQIKRVKIDLRSADK